MTVSNDALRLRRLNIKFNIIYIMRIISCGFLVASFSCTGLKNTLPLFYGI